MFVPPSAGIKMNCTSSNNIPHRDLVAKGLHVVLYLTVLNSILTQPFPKVIHSDNITAHFLIAKERVLCRDASLTHLVVVLLFNLTPANFTYKQRSQCKHRKLSDTFLITLNDMGKEIS